MSDKVLASAEAIWGGALGGALERLEAQSESMISRTERWSAINSGSRELGGLALMREALAAEFSALPGAISEEKLAPTEAVRADGTVEGREHGASIRVQVRPDAPIRVALTGHYDTVFPASHPFQKNWREGEMLRGPGVADMKGGLSLMLEALLAFEALPGEKRVGYEVLLSPDEEIGSPASAALLAELGARSQLGMTYEPAMASGALVSTRKGSGNYSLAFSGRAAHVGRAFADGRNAVLAAAEAAVALNALNGQREGVTFNVGAIEGGSPVNIVPDKAVLRFNVRAPDADSVSWAEGEVRRIGACACEGVGLRLHGGFARQPKVLSKAQQTIIAWTRDAGAALGLQLGFQPSGGVCEGNNLAAVGCPNIDTLGPCGGGLHSDEEFARMSSFAERAKLSFLMLAGLESGAFNPADLRA